MYIYFLLLLLLLSLLLLLHFSLNSCFVLCSVISYKNWLHFVPLVVIFWVNVYPLNFALALHSALIAFLKELN